MVCTRTAAHTTATSTQAPHLEAPFVDAPGGVLDTLASLKVLLDCRVVLHALKLHVGVHVGVGVVQTHDQANLWGGTNHKGAKKQAGLSLGGKRSMRCAQPRGEG